MKFDGFQQISAAIFVLAAGLFVAHTLQRRTTASDSVSVPSRIFLPDDINAEYLTGLYKTNTALQADGLAAPYRGRWMRVSGSVDNVSEEYGVFTISAFFPESRQPHRAVVLLRFDKRRADQVSLLKRGSALKAIGKVDIVNAAGVSLADCEF